MRSNITFDDDDDDDDDYMNDPFWLFFSGSHGQPGFEHPWWSFYVCKRRKKYRPKPVLWEEMANVRITSAAFSGPMNNLPTSQIMKIVLQYFLSPSNIYMPWRDSSFLPAAPEVRTVRTSRVIHWPALQ